MSLAKKIGLGILLMFVALQFFRPARNKSMGMLTSDVTQVVLVPDDVHKVLVRSCYDCHSDNTVYPWYMEVQPVAWYLANHIKDGKRALNFSEFGALMPRKQMRKLQDVAKEVQKGDMPLSSYTLIHKDAKLSEAEKALVVSWADSLVAKW